VIPGGAVKSLIVIPVIEVIVGKSHTVTHFMEICGNEVGVVGVALYRSIACNDMTY